MRAASTRTSSASTRAVTQLRSPLARAHAPARPSITPGTLHVVATLPRGAYVPAGGPADCRLRDHGAGRSLLDCPELVGTGLGRAWSASSRPSPPPSPPPLPSPSPSSPFPTRLACLLGTSRACALNITHCIREHFCGVQYSACARACMASPSSSWSIFVVAARMCWHSFSPAPTLFVCL